MKIRTLALILGGTLAGSLLTLAALPKSYQFTGLVKSVQKDTISVDNGKEVWIFGLNAESKGGENLKVGDKVTVEYRMFAAKIEVKAPDNKAKTEKPAKK